jgi:integrase/recombinase XerD
MDEQDAQEQERQAAKRSAAKLSAKKSRERRKQRTLPTYTFARSRQDKPAGAGAAANAPTSMQTPEQATEQATAPVRPFTRDDRSGLNAPPRPPKKPPPAQPAGAGAGAIAGTPQANLALWAAMRRYLEHRAMLGATQQGLYNTERYLRDFILWACERGVGHPAQVSRQVLERYQRWLYHYRKQDGEPLHVRSQRGKVIPLKGWFRWMTKSGEIGANPAADLDLPRDVRRIPRNVLTAQDAQAVLALPDLASLLGLRDRAIIEVLYATGIRRMELAQLATHDIDPQRGVLLVREGKGRKDRLVPLGERALYWVRRYQEEAREQLAWDSGEHTLFLNKEGRPMNPCWLSTMVAQYVKAAGVSVQGGCHLWRHTVATLMLEGGADIRFIQALLGHEDINSTQIYTQVAIRQLQKVHAMTHPATQLEGRLRDEWRDEARDGEAPEAETGAAKAGPQVDDENAAQAPFDDAQDRPFDDAQDRLLAALDAEAQADGE